MCACIGGGEENVWSLPTMFHEQLECKPFANYTRNSHDLSRAHCTTSTVCIQILQKQLQQILANNVFPVNPFAANYKSFAADISLASRVLPCTSGFSPATTMSCWLCRVTLSRACDRRRVYSYSTSHVVPILEDFLSSFQSTSHRDILERSAV